MEVNSRVHLESLFNNAPEGQSRVDWHDFDLLLIKAQWGELALSEWGAQVLWYRPAGHRPVLWTTDSPAAKPKALRGGVPICWPWFGDHPTDAFLPAHGVARTAQWEISRKEMDDTSLFIELSPQEMPLWNTVELGLQIQASATALTLMLTSRNRGAADVEVSQALHSYLAISSRSKVEVTSLDGNKYADKLAGFDEFTQQGPLIFDQPVDRIYQSESAVLLRDEGWQRVLEVDKLASGSTVVWNPGEAGASIGDIGQRQYDQFVCFEAARTRQYDRQRLAPNESITLGTSLRVRSL